VMAGLYHCHSEKHSRNRVVFMADSSVIQALPEMRSNS